MDDDDDDYLYSDATGIAVGGEKIRSVYVGRLGIFTTRNMNTGDWADTCPAGEYGSDDDYGSYEEMSVRSLSDVLPCHSRRQRFRARCKFEMKTHTHKHTRARVCVHVVRMLLPHEQMCDIASSWTTARCHVLAWGGARSLYNHLVV